MTHLRSPLTQAASAVAAEDARPCMPRCRWEPSCRLTSLHTDACVPSGSCTILHGNGGVGDWTAGSFSGTCAYCLCRHEQQLSAETHGTVVHCTSKSLQGGCGATCATRFCSLLPHMLAPVPLHRRIWHT